MLTEASTLEHQIQNPILNVGAAFQICSFKKIFKCRGIRHEADG
jgi:hypothetical protein